MKLIVKVIRQADSYHAWCPALPGCRVSADSAQEARELIKSAVAGYIASMNVALPRELGRLLKVEAA